MHSFEINQQHIMSEVYSYPFPEVRQTIASARLDPEFMLNTLPADRAAGMLAVYGFEPALDLPEHADGALNLDELHVPVIDRIRNVVAESLPGIEGFDHSYPTPGSSQSMFTLMAEWKAQGKLQSVAVIKGEYEGYAAYAQSLHIPVRYYDDYRQTPQDGEVWFVSNPSARDGNWLDDDEWQDFAGRGHDIVYDAAYVGLTADDRQVDVSSPHIKAVLTSPSKLFGVFRYRNTGVTYTREPVASMYGNKWFKDVPALLDSLNLYERYGRRELPKQYKPVQRLICRALAEVTDSDVTPSDVLLLAHSQQPPKPQFEKFKRGDAYRFGLTKLFEDVELAK